MKPAGNLIAIGGLRPPRLGRGRVADGSAIAAAVVGTGAWQVASAQSADGTAANALDVDGTMIVAANAFAEADGGGAAAFGIVGIGVYQEANGAGGAANAIDVAGTLAIGAQASAIDVGDGSAFASGLLVGIVQLASARSDTITNDALPGGTLVFVNQSTPAGPATGGTGQ